MVDPLVRDAEFGFVGNRPACIGIPVEPGEVAAADFEPDAMTGAEHIARHAGVDADLVDLAGFGKHRLIQ